VPESSLPNLDARIVLRDIGSMLAAIGTARTALVVALADHQSDWSAIVEMIGPVGLDVGQVKNSDTGQPGVR
jgi:hypothetical protein